MNKQPPRWDLTPLYQSIDDPQIGKDLSAAAMQARRFALRGQGKIAAMRPADFGRMIADYDKLNAKTDKINAFAEMTYTADRGDERNAAFYEKMQARTNGILSKTDFFESEIADLPDEALNRLMTDKTAQKYGFWIERVRADRVDLDDKALTQIAKNAAKTEKALRLYDKTQNGIVFTLDGKKATSDDLYAMAYSTDENKRYKAGLAMNDGYKSKAGVFASVVNTVAKNKAFADEKQGFKSPVESRNKSNQIDNAVVSALVSSVDEAMPAVAHRYYALKAKWAGRDKIGYWDRNAPVAGIAPRRYTFDEAKDIVLSAYDSFDKEMGGIARGFFDEKRIDAEPRPGKEPGEYAMPIVNGKPYIKMSFGGTTNDVLALAHELGHGIHYELAKKQGSLGMQMPVTVEETASIFGEMLTFDALLKRENDPKQRFALLSDKMNRVMLTTFRQIALHHYEEDIHTAVREKGAVSVSEINKAWTDAQQKMMGPAVINDERSASCWADVPHLLKTPFYVYGYAYGECMTSSLYQVYKDGKIADFPKKYKEMLAKGSTERPDKLLQPFGLDVSKPDFWKQGLGMMKGYVDKLERLTPSMTTTKTAALLKQSKTASR